MTFRNTTLAITAAFTASLLLSACASTAAGNDKDRGIDGFKGDARLGEEVNKICFNRNIDGFSMARKKTVVLSKGASKDYIVEVRGFCRNLSYAQSIGIDATQTCVSRGDYLIVSDTLFGNENGHRSNRCYIDRMYEWDKKAVQKSDMETEEMDDSGS